MACILNYETQLEDLLQDARELIYINDYLLSLERKLKDNKFIRHSPAAVLQKEMVKGVDAREKQLILFKKMRGIRDE